MSQVATDSHVTASHGGADHSPYLAHHFDDLDQQAECATLGMWLFLATEVLLFGGIFLAYIIYRREFYEGWNAASDRLYVSLGTLNTVILLTSSFFVVLAVHAAHVGDNKGIVRWLIPTIILGISFLVVKGFEYHNDYVEGIIPWLNWNPVEPFHAPRDPLVDDHAKLFMVFYFTMTLIHALHMTIGAGVLAWIAWRAHKREFKAEYFTPVDMSGLYWHFVDVVWIFLFPMLYLVNPATKGLYH
jgi:cytochrome c oxidase subunit 3